jgi:hypothetical protein
MPTAAIHIMCQELNYQRLPCSKMDIVERIFSGLSFIKVLIMSNSTVKELIYIYLGISTNYVTLNPTIPELRHCISVWYRNYGGKKILSNPPLMNPECFG